MIATFVPNPYAADGRSVSPNLFVQLNDVTVGNTAAELTILGTGVGSLTIPAGYFISGKMVRCVIRGKASTVNSDSPTLRLKVKFGNTVLIDSGAQDIFPGLVDGSFHVEFDIVCRVPGSNGSVIGFGWGFVGDRIVSGPVEVPDIIELNGAPIVLDTTAPQTLNVTAQWGLPSPDNTLTTSIANVA